MEAQQAFAGLESGLDITVGEFNFFVDRDGRSEERRVGKEC